jgi:ubiquinone/menaquinone biosynthesis C-methylase UbiE
MSWFKNWFNELYPIVYPTRTREEADREVEFIAAQLPGIAKFSCLDVGCGDGRHLPGFALAAKRCIGLDLSDELLKIARKTVEGLPNGSLIRADFRALPFQSNSFELLSSLFTGFGYLETDDEHLQLLGEWCRVVCPGGYFVLDFLDREYVLSNIVAESNRAVADLKITERRYLSADKLRIEKDIAIQSLSTGAINHFKESVRAYSAREIFSMLEKKKFKPDQVFSDYCGTPFVAGSGRLIVFSRKHF